MRPNNRKSSIREIQEFVAPTPAEIIAERQIAEDESRMTAEQIYEKWYIEDYQKQIMEEAYAEYENEFYSDIYDDPTDQSWLMEEEDWETLDRMLEEDDVYN